MAETRRRQNRWRCVKGGGRARRHIYHLCQFRGPEPSPHPPVHGVSCFQQQTAAVAGEGLLRLPVYAKSSIFRHRAVQGREEEKEKRRERSGRTRQTDRAGSHRVNVSPEKSRILAQPPATPRAAHPRSPRSTLQTLYPRWPLGLDPPEGHRGTALQRGYGEADVGKEQQRRPRMHLDPALLLPPPPSTFTFLMTTPQPLKASPRLKAKSTKSKDCQSFKAKMSMLPFLHKAQKNPTGLIIIRAGLRRTLASMTITWTGAVLALVLLPPGQAFFSSVPAGCLQQGLNGHRAWRVSVATLREGEQRLGGFSLDGRSITVGRRPGSGILGKLSGSLNDAITQGLVKEATTHEHFEEIKNSKLAVIALSATTCRKVCCIRQGAGDACMLSLPISTLHVLAKLDYARHFLEITMAEQSPWITSSSWKIRPLRLLKRGPPPVRLPPR